MRFALLSRCGLLVGPALVLSSLFSGVLSNALAVDAELVALTVKTGAKDTAALERMEEWAAAAADPVAATTYLARARADAFANPRDVETVRHYIQVATSQTQTDALVEELEAYAESNPDRTEAHYYLGLAKPTEGAAHFARALELDPKSYYALVGAASAELTSTAPDMGRAKEHLLQAARLEPDQPLAYVVLEQFYRQTGDTDSQVLAMGNAVEADPWDARLRQSLLRQLQAQAQATQSSGGSLETWAENTTALLSRLARSGDGQPELAVATARIWGSLGNDERALDQLRLAADLGFADPLGLEFEQTLAAVVGGNPGIGPVLEKMHANRKSRQPELKARAMESLITTETPPLDSVPLLGGGTLDLASKRGKVVVLDFWATWCGPCRRSLPVLQKLHERKMKDVEVYCVNVFERDGGQQIETFWQTGGYPMPVALGTEAWASAFRVNSIPALFVIGPDGQIRYRHEGFSPYLDEELGWIAEGLLEAD